MYIEFHQTIKTQKGSCIQTVAKYLEKDTKNFKCLEFIQIIV